MKRKSGFTLIELILTLAILAILASIAQANFALILENARFKADVQTARNIVSAARMKHLSEALGPKDYINGSDLDNSILEIEKAKLQSKHIQPGDRMVDSTGRYWGNANVNVGKFMLLQFSDGYGDDKYEYGVLWIDRYYRTQYYIGHIVKEGEDKPIDAIDVFFQSGSNGYPTSMTVNLYVLSEHSGGQTNNMYYRGIKIFN